MTIDFILEKINKIKLFLNTSSIEKYIVNEIEICKKVRSIGILIRNLRKYEMKIAGIQATM